MIHIDPISIRWISTGSHSLGRLWRIAKLASQSYIVNYCYRSTWYNKLHLNFLLLTITAAIILLFSVWFPFLERTKQKQKISNLLDSWRLLGSLLVYVSGVKCLAPISQCDRKSDETPDFHVFCMRVRGNLFMSDIALRVQINFYCYKIHLLLLWQLLLSSFHLKLLSSSLLLQ